MTEEQKNTEEHKKSYLEMLAEKIIDLDKKLDDFKVIAQETTSEVKDDLSEVIDNLKSKRGEVNETVQNIKNSSGEGWVELKSAAEKSFDELKKGFQSAYSKFKEEEKKQAGTEEENTDQGE